MENFDKKIKNLKTLFIYKYKIYDREKQKLKIYFISPDKSHIYISVDHVINTHRMYLCEVGDLYFDKKRKVTFEDTPNETFYISKNDYKTFRKLHDNQPYWCNSKITDIVNSYDNKEDVWFF